MQLFLYTIVYGYTISTSPDEVIDGSQNVVAGEDAMIAIEKVRMAIVANPAPGIDLAVEQEPSVRRFFVSSVAQVAAIDGVCLDSLVQAGVISL